MPRDLTSLFAPSSVAIVGASNDPAKWGNWLARGALRGRDRRSVYLINRNGAEVLGEPTYASIQELPQAPELVVISVPAAGFEQAVDDALAAGARALVGITAGLGEAGGEAAAARAGAGGAGARRRRDAARAQLPGRVRRGQRARPALQRPAVRVDRADLPERQPGARAGHPRRRPGHRLLAVRLDRQPVRHRPGRAGGLVRRRRRHRHHRHLRRGLPRRPRLRRRRRRCRQAGGADYGRLRRGQHPRRRLAHGGAGQLGGGGGRRLPRRGRAPGVDADRR